MHLYAVLFKIYTYLTSLSTDIVDVSFTFPIYSWRGCGFLACYSGPLKGLQDPAETLGVKCAGGAQPGEVWSIP